MQYHCIAAQTLPSLNVQPNILASFLFSGFVTSHYQYRLLEAGRSSRNCKTFNSNERETDRTVLSVLSFIAEISLVLDNFHYFDYC